MAGDTLQQQEEQQNPMQGQPQNQNSATVKQEQREADNRLLDIVSNQLHALGAAVNRMCEMHPGFGMPAGHHEHEAAQAAKA